MVKLFTHTDLDGIGCAILTKLALENNGCKVDITYCDYDDINQKVKEFVDSDAFKIGDFCLITDISITEELASEIDRKYDHFCLLDHHPTALNLNKFDWCTVKVEDEETNLKTSGTEMVFKELVSLGYFDKELCETFATLVRDYDTWRWSSLGEDGLICKQVNDLLYMYGRDKFINWCISEISDGVFPRLYASDKLLLNMKQKEIDEYVEYKDKQMMTSPMCGYVCGFVFAEKYHSELGNRLCKMHPEIDFVALINIDGTVSYRTMKDYIDLGKDVAKLFGGGGHPKAAGSQFDKSIMLNTIPKIFA